MRSKFEIKAQKELEADGWKVDYKIHVFGFKSPRNYQVDYLGLFDLLAYKPFILRFIAIKGQGGVPKKLRQDISAMRMGDNVVKEIWRYSQPTENGKRVKNKPYLIRKEIIE